MRICPKCHAQGIDENQEQCKNCHVRFINLADTIYLDKAQLNEIAEDIIKNPRVLLFTLLFGIAVVFFVNEYAESRVSKSIADMKEKTDAQLSAAYQDMTTKIAAEFQQQRVKDIVAQVAASQASNLLVQQISPEIDSFRSYTSNTLAEFDDSFQSFQKQSTNALADLRATTQFSLLVTKAFSDDYASFKQLLRISQDTNSAFKKEADKSYGTIYSRLLTEPGSFENSGVDWKQNGIDFEKESFKQLAEDVQSSTNLTIGNEALLLRAVTQNERFPKYDRINLLISIMTNSPSITLRNEACY